MSYRTRSSSLDARYNLLMLSGDTALARGDDGAFYQLLARFAPYWKRIDILTPTVSGAHPRTVHETVHVHPAPYHRALQPYFIRRRGAALLAQRPYHLVVSHDFGFFYNGIGAWWLLRGRDLPLVSEIHHIEGYPHAVTRRERLWRWAARQYLPRIGQRAQAVRVVNHDLAQQVIAFGVPAHKVHVLHSLYMDFDIYQPQAVPKQYDVLFVGRLASNKGILHLLEAVERVAQTHPTVTLAIRGSGALRAEIEARAQARGLNVTFLPRVAHTRDMAQVYSRARLLVCASTVEGNPRVTIEAMACGVPVISTRVGIMPQVIDDGENGYLVDNNPDAIARAIRRLLDDPDHRARIGERGRVAVQGFAAATTVPAYATAYHAIIAAHHAAS